MRDQEETTRVAGCGHSWSFGGLGGRNTSHQKAAQEDNDWALADFGLDRSRLPRSGCCSSTTTLTTTTTTSLTPSVLGRQQRYQSTNAEGYETYEYALAFRQVRGYYDFISSSSFSSNAHKHPTNVNKKNDLRPPRVHIPHSPSIAPQPSRSSSSTGADKASNGKKTRHHVHLTPQTQLSISAREKLSDL